MSKIGLEIFTDNGKCLSFGLNDASRLEEIVGQLKSPRLFTQKVLVLASDTSVASIQTDRIELVRLHLPQEGEIEPDESSEDLVEISKAAFEAEYLPLPDEEKVAPRYAQPGDLMTTYLQIQLESGAEVFIEIHVIKKASQEGRVFFAHLFERPSMEFRLQSGGFGIIRPSKITSQMTYPGPGADVLPGNAIFVG